MFPLPPKVDQGQQKKSNNSKEKDSKKPKKKVNHRQVNTPATSEEDKLNHSEKLSFLSEEEARPTKVQPTKKRIVVTENSEAKMEPVANPSTCVVP